MVLWATVGGFALAYFAWYVVRGGRWRTSAAWKGLAAMVAGCALGGGLAYAAMVLYPGLATVALLLSGCAIGVAYLTFRWFFDWYDSGGYDRYQRRRRNRHKKRPK